MTDVLTIYSTPTCVTCRAIMRDLDKQGIPFKKVDVTEDAEGAERLKRAGFQQVPVIGYGGHLGPVSDLPGIVKTIKEKAA